MNWTVQAQAVRRGRMVLYFPPDNGHEYEKGKSMDGKEYEEREDEEETYEGEGETKQSLQ